MSFSMFCYSRHPRFTIALLVIIFVSILLLVNSNPHKLILNSMGFQNTGSNDGGSDLAAKLNIEEVYYQKMLEQRQDLIKKYGPTPNMIETFPSDGKLYSIWDFFLPSFNCPHRVQRVGAMGDGGKWMCGLERIIPKKNCVIYSFGVNEESSFEADILKAAPGCEVYGYDFSVTSFGPEIELEPDLKARSHFTAWGLGPEDTFSLEFNAKVFTLRTLMERNGHDFIDVLKIDIEGAEYDSLTAFFHGFHGEPLPIGQLQMEMHLFGGRKWDHFPTFLHWWEQLESAGLRPFYSEPNLPYVSLGEPVRPELSEYSFINIRGTHELVTNNPQPYPRLSQ